MTHVAEPKPQPKSHWWNGMVDTAKEIGTAIGAAVKTGGLAVVVVIVVGVLAYLALGNNAHAGNYSSDQAARDWATQHALNATIAKTLDEMHKDLESHKREVHPGTATANASIEAKLTDILRRLDRIEAKVDR